VEGKLEDSVLKLGKYEFNSRLFVGTGKYETFEIMKEALKPVEQRLSL